jgi:hypothetical protein
MMSCKRRQRVDPAEQLRHPAGADHLQIVDAVRFRGHPHN